MKAKGWALVQASVLKIGLVAELGSKIPPRPAVDVFAEQA